MQLGMGCLSIAGLHIRPQLKNERKSVDDSLSAFDGTCQAPLLLDSVSCCPEGIGVRLCKVFGCFREVNLQQRLI